MDPTGFDTPEDAALSGWPPPAMARVIDLRFENPSRARVLIDTTPSHPMLVTCDRDGDLRWHWVADQSFGAAFDDTTELSVVVIDGSIERSRSGSITATLWLDYGGEAFPGPKWSDFVAILGWWRAELNTLPAHRNPSATATLRFMEGPMTAQISAPDGPAASWRARLLMPSGSHERIVADIRFPIEPRRRSLSEAIARVRQASQARGWPAPLT